MKLADCYVTLNQAAEAVGVERHTVWRWIKEGKLEAEKVGNCVLIERQALAQLSQAEPKRQRSQEVEVKV